MALRILLYLGGPTNYNTPGSNSNNNGNNTSSNHTNCPSNENSTAVSIVVVDVILIVAILVITIRICDFDKRIKILIETIMKVIIIIRITTAV